MINLLPIRLLRHPLVQNPQLWLRPLIIIGLLLFSAALAWKASPSQLRLAWFDCCIRSRAGCSLPWPQWLKHDHDLGGHAAWPVAAGHGGPPA
jgi:hypothetical protein